MLEALADSLEKTWQARYKREFPSNVRALWVPPEHWTDTLWKWEAMRSVASSPCSWEEEGVQR